MSTELEKSESAARWAFERDQELVRRLGDEVDRLTATLESARNLCSRRCIPSTLGRGQDEH